MATIDLGKIKIVWRGTYAGGTAYTPDDAVVHSGTSYICIANTTGNTPPNATYWNVLAQAGTNGTDVGTTLTTQGDILYRDGSGLQRLAAGTSGQVLQTGGSGANPSWTTVAGGAFGQVQYRINDTTYSNSNTSNYVTATNTYVEIAPSSSAAGKKILVNFNVSIYFNHNASDCSFQYIITRTVGGSTSDIYTSSNTEIYRNDAGNLRILQPIWYEDTPQTTSTVRYGLKFRNPHSASTITLNEGTTRMLAYEVN
jgi:hypothetical protein